MNLTVCRFDSACDDLDSCRVAEAAQQGFAIFPPEPKGAGVGDTDSGNNLGQVRGVDRIELSVHHRAFSPTHELVQSNAVMQVGSDPLGAGTCVRST